MAKEEQNIPQLNQDYSTIDKELKREQLVTEAQPVIKRVFFGSWIGLDLLLVVGGIAYIFFYLFVGAGIDERRIARAGENQVSQRQISVARSAQPLDIGPTQTVSLGSGAFDLFTRVENGNTDWSALVRYKYVYASGETRVEDAVILPDSDQILASLRQEATSRPTAARLEIIDVMWSRVNPHRVDDYEIWLADRNTFLVENAQHAATVEVDGDAIPSTTFTITNHSAFNYWEPEFIVEILRGGSTAAVNSVTIPSFLSGESRDITVRWFGNAPASGTVRVRPMINYFDEDVYMDQVGGTPSDIRDLFFED